MLSPYGKREWTVCGGIGLLLVLVALLLQWWIVAGVLVLLTVALLGFFRDPIRQIPSQRGVMVSPADGRVSSVHDVEHFEPFNGPAVCVRIFLSVLDVHVNRCPCHGQIKQITYTPGEFLNALKPESAQRNESNLLVFVHPNSGAPVAAVKQIAGAIARRIVCAAVESEIFQRGQRFGMIKFGSTTELYVPKDAHPQVMVHERQYVYGGSTVLVRIAAPNVSATTGEAVMKGEATSSVAPTE